MAPGGERGRPDRQTSPLRHGLAGRALKWPQSSEHVRPEVLDAFVTQRLRELLPEAAYLLLKLGAVGAVRVVGGETELDWIYILRGKVRAFIGPSTSDCRGCKPRVSAMLKAISRVLSTLLAATSTWFFSLGGVTALDAGGSA